MTTSETRPRATVVVPGNHDGVHVGHRALLSMAREVADRRDLDVLALTFSPHPLEVLREGQAPTPLTTIARRQELLLAAGADRVEVAKFDRAYAQQTAQDFAAGVSSTLGAKAIVVGPDFRFGAGREGDTGRLSSLGIQLDFEVHTLSMVDQGGARVSSTRIREALARGDLDTVAAGLSRAHDVEGVVVRGHQRGRTIGFPTANLDPDPVLLPADGVYAVVARVEGREALVHGVSNLGTRPTFAAGRSVETHLFDFEGDLYGTRLRVAFISRLREERRFPDAETLVAQIRADAAGARALLADAPASLWRYV